MTPKGVIFVRLALYVAWSARSFAIRQEIETRETERNPVAVTGSITVENGGRLRGLHLPRQRQRSPDPLGGNPEPTGLPRNRAPNLRSDAAGRGSFLPGRP